MSKIKEQRVETATQYDDVDEVMELAERLRSEDVVQFSASEMAEMGDELGIPAEYIEQARSQLRERRLREEKLAAEKQAQQKKLVRFAVIGSVVLVAVFGVWSMSASSKVGQLATAADSAIAQVESVQERQKSVKAMLADRPDSPDKDAELIGAENRVRVELKRCNDVVVRYNQYAGTFPASLWADSSPKKCQ